MKSTPTLLQRVSWLAFAALLLVGCQSPEPQELRFETIEQGEGFPTGRSYAEKEPNMLVIATPEEIDSPGLNVQFTSGIVDRLRAVDYQHNFVMIVFQGLLGYRTPKDTIAIREIIRTGKGVTVRVHLVRLEKGELTQSAFSSPYLILSIPKDGEWDQDIKFILEVDEKEAADLTHFVP